MSASSNGVKPGFIGFLRGLFNRPTVRTEDFDGQTTEYEQVETPVAPPPLVHSAGGQSVRIPLQSVVTALPLELQGRVRSSSFGSLMVAVPQEIILAQLGQGAVRVPFGLIRHAAPAAFLPGNEFDELPVALPLNEILSRLNPALITRRRAQRQIEVSDEVSSPFDLQIQTPAFSVGNPNTETPAAPLRATLPPRRDTVAAPTVTASAPHVMSPPRGLPPTAPAPIIAREAQVPSRTPQPAPRAVVADPADTESPFVFTPPVKAVKSTPRVPAATVAAPAGAPSRTVGDPLTAMLTVPLTALAENWPDTVRQEIVRLNLLNARVALPADLVEPALKRGRVVFSWKTVRSWIRPAPQASVSAHDATELELALKLVAPLFIQRKNAELAKTPKIAIDETIPNLFFGFPKPEQQDGASTGRKAPDTNYYVFGDTSDSAHVDETEYKIKPKGPGGTEFVTRYATPNEIVSRAAALDGVAGALVALPDGLMVASRIPAELNGDTLAAFLPQIFAKVSVTTKELRMGELNNLSFTVGNVPWKIFRVHAIFFAAFGRAGEGLPSAQLAALAGELDRKNK